MVLESNYFDKEITLQAYISAVSYCFVLLIILINHALIFVFNVKTPFFQKYVCLFNIIIIIRN